MLEQSVCCYTEISSIGITIVLVRRSISTCRRFWAFVSYKKMDLHKRKELWRKMVAS